jgi:hypothetical protein
LSELAALAIGPEQAAVAAAGVVRYVEVASAQDPGTEGCPNSRRGGIRRLKMRKGQHTATVLTFLYTPIIDTEYDVRSIVIMIT